MSHNLPPKLINYGNTCYFNSIIQCLLNSSSLHQALVANNDKNALRQALYSYFQHPHQVNQYFRPLLDQFLACSNFALHQSNDASECLLLLLEALNLPAYNYLLKFSHIEQGAKCFSTVQLTPDCQMCVVIINRLQLKTVLDRGSTYAYVNKDDQLIDIPPLLGHMEIKSVVCHLGSARGGHYYAVVKKDNQWWRCDDSCIQVVKGPPLNQVVMVFYE